MVIAALDLKIGGTMPLLVNFPVPAQTLHMRKEAYPVLTHKQAKSQKNSSTSAPQGATTSEISGWNRDVNGVYVLRDGKKLWRQPRALMTL